VNGTGEVFERFKGSPGGGVEAGVKLLGLTLWGDFQFMGDSQYLGSGNLGYELSFGKKLRFTVGGYLGVLAFGFPPPEDSSALSVAQRMKLMGILDPFNINVNDFEEKYQELSGGDALKDKAFGGNARLRLVLEYQLVPHVYLGMQGGMGYHFIINGEEATNSATNLAVDAFLKGQPLDKQQQERASKEIKDVLGIESTNLEDLAGVNYHVGAFVNLSF
jgi:hypothetical protein